MFASTARCARCGGLIYCGEWIESHALHIYMLHAPDFLGYESAIHMAKDHRDIVQRGLQLKKAGNEVVSLLGGREIHPINVRVGGFYKVPSKSELAPLAERLEWARDAALETVRWVAAFPFPDFEQDYEFVALNHPDEYPFNEGRIVSNKGLDIDVRDYDANFVEEHVQWSNALHSTIKGRGAYFCGPMARFNLNFEKLRPIAKQAAAEAGIAGRMPQPIQEHHCSVRRSAPRLRRSARHHRRLRTARPPCAGSPPRAPQPATPAPKRPRGILYHRYRIDDRGDNPRREDRARQLHRIRKPSKAISGALFHRASVFQTTNLPGNASRPSATTIPASPARRTS